MKWTEKEHNAIRATLEHWADDIIKELEKGASLNEEDFGASSCPLCDLVWSCKDCPYYKFYKKACFAPGEAYNIFRLWGGRSVVAAIDCYNKAADMINAEHYGQ